MYKVIVTSLETGEIVDTIISPVWPARTCWDIELNDYDKKCEIVEI